MTTATVKLDVELAVVFELRIPLLQCRRLEVDVTLYC